MGRDAASYCQEHKKLFKTMTEMHNHLKNDHENLVCEICGKIVANLVAKRLHMRVEHASLSFNNKKK